MDTEDELTMTEMFRMIACRAICVVHPEWENDYNLHVVVGDDNVEDHWIESALNRETDPVKAEFLSWLLALKAEDYGY